MMNFKQYMDFTNTTAIYPDDHALEYLALGLASEAGEVAGVLKKKIRDNTSFSETREKLKAELGDVMWYVAQLCYLHDLDIDHILMANIAKLQSRKERNKLEGDGDYR